jgi:hypothetical protein
MRPHRRTPTAGTDAEATTVGERVEGWALAGAAGAIRAAVDGELIEDAFGTVMVAGCETTAKAEDVSSRRADVELSAVRMEGKDWNESGVGMGSAVNAKGMCALESGPSFFGDFGRIRLSQVRLSFLEGKLIVSGSWPGMGQATGEVARFTS